MSALFVLFSLFIIYNNSYASLTPWKHPQNTKTNKVRVGYWPAYAPEQYPASAIDSSLFTHLNYAFVQLNSTTNKLEAENPQRLRTFSHIVKSRNPALRTLIAIGGGGSNSTAFSVMASSSTTRATFIASSIQLARLNHFDGLDLDWEFPQSQQDMDNLGLLFAQWREALDVEAAHSGLCRLLLTAAVYYSATLRFVGEGTYPTESINRNLDWVGLMAFDYHGSWAPTVTGAHTALYDPSSDINTNAGVGRWIEAGLKPDKGVLGLAMYGRSWILKDPSKPGIGAAAVSAGPGDATPVFADIMKMITANKSAVVVYDNVTVTAYAQVGSLWIGFDNVESIRNKVTFLKSKCMKGYFFWTASFDTSISTLSRTAAKALAL